MPRGWKTSGDGKKIGWLVDDQSGKRRMLNGTLREKSEGKRRRGSGGSSCCRVRRQRLCAWTRRVRRLWTLMRLIVGLERL
jgi:hypothetical protein